MRPGVATADHQGRPRCRRGVNAALLTTSPRPDGTTQLTYNGHPLYYYGDDQAGNHRGRRRKRLRSEWYLLTPAGLKIDND